MMTTPHLVHYERKHRKDVLSLLFYSRRNHNHLDWYRTGQWLDMEGNMIQLAYDEQGNLLGMMGLSATLHATRWVRLLALRNDVEITPLLIALWDALWLRIVTAQGEAETKSVAILVVNTWLVPYLPYLGFQYVEDVVTMYRTGHNLPELHQHDIFLRNGYSEDISEIMRVDHAAFQPPWQMTRTDIYHSQREAASCTLAIYDNEVVGYEISTRHHTSGHLARLAVLPQMQGKRVGAVLLDNVIDRFNRRGVRNMTVNTQQSNIRSQRLYSRYFFRRNGFDIPIWQTSLS